MQRVAGNAAIVQLLSDAQVRSGAQSGGNTQTVIQRDGDFGAALNDPGHPGGRGAQKFAAIDRADWQSYFQLALQGVTGKAKLTAQKKAELAGAIADECMSRGTRHGCEITSAMAGVNDAASKTELQLALNMTGIWGTSFKSALQTTSGGDYKKPAEPVRQAADIADQAVLVSGNLDESLWKVYMKVVADQACVSSES